MARLVVHPIFLFIFQHLDFLRSLLFSAPKNASFYCLCIHFWKKKALMWTRVARIVLGPILVPFLMSPPTVMNYVSTLWLYVSSLPTSLPVYDDDVPNSNQSTPRVINRNFSWKQRWRQQISMLLNKAMITSWRWGSLRMIFIMSAISHSRPSPDFVGSICITPEEFLTIARWLCETGLLIVILNVWSLNISYYNNKHRPWPEIPL